VSKKAEFGKTQNELDADKMLECRKIVKNLINFGVSEKQKLQLIYLLALEMESRDALETIVSAVKSIKNNKRDLKFVLTDGEEEYNDKNRSSLIDV
tara:strand:+ start:812 stop:1099 length:288 start_codon:yes stop_codon:yes gene_type:complete